MDWDHLWGYAFPPQPILAKDIQKIRASTCRVILIASAWRQQAYYPDLLELSARPPFRLPLLPELLSQPVSGVFHQQPEFLKLHAWLLNTGPWQPGDFRKKQPPGSRLLKPNPLWEFTKQSGESSLIGVRDGIRIHSKCLPL